MNIDTRLKKIEDNLAVEGTVPHVLMVFARDGNESAKIAAFVEEYGREPDTIIRIEFVKPIHNTGGQG